MNELNYMIKIKKPKKDEGGMMRENTFQGGR